MVWCHAVFPLLFVLSCLELQCTSSPILQATGYKYSLRLTRLTRTRVGQLLGRYKEQELGDKYFEDRSLQLKALPVFSIDFHSWLQLKDWDRLHNACQNLQTFWDMLEWKREQLLGEEVEQWGAQGGKSARPALTLPKVIEHIQLDLRDLIGQVKSLMENVRGDRTSQNSTSFPEVTSSPPLRRRVLRQTPWVSRLEGYVILRDLDLYLTKVARDFLLLATNERNTSGSHVGGTKV